MGKISVLRKLCLKSSKKNIIAILNIFIEITLSLPNIIFITLRYFYIQKVGRYFFKN